MKREELISYGMNFASFIIQQEAGKKINRIILFGSVARGDFDKESDIDIFIDTQDNKIEAEINKLLSLFLKSEIQKKWELKGLKQDISLKVGKLDEWKLKRSIISDGIMLYGKFKDIPDEVGNYSVLELLFDTFNRNKKVSLWRKLYGYKQKVDGVEYATDGLIDECGGKRLEKVVIVPSEKALPLLDFLHKYKIKHTIREIWSDNV